MPEGFIKQMIKYVFDIRGVTLIDNIRLFTNIPIINGLNYILYKLNINISYSFLQNQLILIKYRDKDYSPKFLIRPYSGDLYDVLSEKYELSNWLSPVLNEIRNAIIVDVGAYIGGYTVRACKKAGQVIAIEPLEDAVLLLRKNVELNGCQNVNIIKKAVWKEKGIVLMKQAKFNEGGSAISPIGDIMVEADTLDNIIRELGISHIDFLKIDIEGAEAEAIQGMRETLKITDYLMIELRSSTLWLINELNKLGFKVLDCVNYGNFINVFLHNENKLNNTHL
ncbi:hypothetical protein Vsou_07420 [Vulcanisaeta souniana JCM 11219]|nr:hypothetical protein Vsou_07420 [Vulcanisaeta souniana JCM 11219]